MSAWEAGYFPEFTERPTTNDLQNTIRNELAGRKRYAGSEQKGTKTIDYDEMRHWYDSRADELGIESKPESLADLMQEVHSIEMSLADEANANDIADQHEMAVRDEYSNFDIPFEVIKNENETKPNTSAANERSVEGQRPVGRVQRTDEPSPEGG